eukprot:CAMPEP_0204213580 /NCGR_PEP_ID=MMETSP0361-20130328/76101_1 /ASSEMBLY_ACC=CAM_ASM_000343 /TAXON_ID=268821 /ORGANISM="Scrippsiella Hangoei, Strain SHTV-5" /LENGTH=58 /DNA_ID=CAMNT_0051178077 /DNA_START=140 /DNA_END=316 /DNA_ORIENTATION=+
MSTKSINACSHWPPFPHAVTAALHVIVSNSTWADAISTKSLSVCSQCPPFSHALTAAL